MSVNNLATPNQVEGLIRGIENHHITPSFISNDTGYSVSYTGITLNLSEEDYNRAFAAYEGRAASASVDEDEVIRSMIGQDPIASVEPDTDILQELVDRVNAIAEHETAHEEHDDTAEPTHVGNGLIAQLRDFQASHSAVPDGESIENILRSMDEERLAAEGGTPAEEAPEEILEPVTPPEIHEEIPTNSGSLLLKEETSRFSSAIWYDQIQQTSILLAGVGGIGSYVGFMLSRMNPAAIYVYDDDRVETVNLSGQLYSKEYVGDYKVNALATTAGKYSNYYKMYTNACKFTSGSNPVDIMICGFDNMAARKTFFDSWKLHVADSPAPERCLFIDGRLAAEEFQVLCIAGDDTYSIQRYEENFLFSDDEADETICSYKQTTFCANMIGSVIVNLFTNFIANQCDPLIPRDLPFLTEYSAERMFFKTIA